jgi:predicted nucleic acid-binding protein
LSTFADSSALVKLYADEDGYQQVRGMAGTAVAQLARVEVPAALWRKQRMGELSADDARLLTADFEADYCLDEAARLCASHGLRAYDAVQLSSALAVRRVDGSCRTFAAFDRPLRTAAATEGFQLLPSNLPHPA